MDSEGKLIKVILRENVVGIGRLGDIKQVKDGFARNFLLPKNLALIATDNNLKKFEVDKKKIEAKRTLEKANAEELSRKLVNFSVTIAVEVNDEERLYGSLTAVDIARAVSAEGVELDKKSILLNAPIRELGIFDLDVRLHPEVASKIKVWVVKK